MLLRCLSRPTHHLQPSSSPLRLLFVRGNPSRSFHRTPAAMAYALPRLPVFEALSRHDPASLAVVHSGSARTFTYGELYKDVAAGRERLREQAGRRGGLDGERVAFLIENGYDYVVTYLSVLANNAIAMPLAASFPASELRYFLNNSGASVFLTSDKHLEQAQKVVEEGIDAQPVFVKVTKILAGSKSVETVTLEDPPDDQGGMILYTSGTTSRPKGVILPTSALAAQAASLIEAWKYTPQDYLLHVLPLHHIHGCINGLITPLMAGSTIEFLFPFNAPAVWNRFAAPFLSSEDSKDKKPITFFTAVPTIYTRLQPTFNDLSAESQEAARKAISPQEMRVAISGSAALPTPTKTAWKDLSNGTVLLERYGMTEVGMALSCGLDFADRVDGSVGWPLPGVEVRLVDTDTGKVVTEEEGEGEIQIRGANVFREYYANAEATASEFVDGGDGRGRWFKTGDVAQRRSVDGAGASGQAWARGPMYFIQGRKSADIIKTGGEKVSALEIERELLSLPEVAECAVVPLDSEQWGQKVAAVVVLTAEGKTAGRGGKPWAIMDLRRALKERLVNYKIPQELRVVPELPRNAMGKINKKQLVKEVFTDS